jgi:antitoxin component of MazEF toxin-antitoxin module
METFEAKVRNVGTSLGILIPNEVIKREKIKIGQEIEASLTKKRNIAGFLKLFRSAKGSSGFKREHAEREF